MTFARHLRWSPFKPWVTLAAIALASLLVAVTVITIVRGAHEAAQLKVDSAMGKARGKATGDAAEIVDKARNDAADTQTKARENADALRKAKGSDQALDPDLNDAGRRGLCRYKAYRSAPECLQQPGRPDPSR